MACSFGNIENACGCLIGYSMPLKQSDDTDITTYPVNAQNVNGDDLGVADSPSAYVALWNADEDDQAVGTLSVGTGSFCFVLSKKTGVTPPSKVLGSVVEPEPPATFAYEYGETDADTTGAPLTEAQYISSVDDVFTAGDEVEGTPELTHGAATLSVTFTNVTDKVLFIQVAASEAAFTKYSVEGDTLQQDQPIDATFGTGTGVWFKSTRDGKKIYITRSQTTFSAAVILSR